MTTRTMSLAVVAALALATAAHGADPGRLPGPEPAGSGPVILAPGLVSTGVTTRDAAQDPRDGALYFCMAAKGYAYAAIMVTRPESGGWTEPQVAPFSGGTDGIDLEPFITRDGARLFFVSTRPHPGAESPNPDLWVADRVGDRWGDPRPVGPPVNTPGDEYFPVVDAAGFLVFTRADSTGGTSSIWAAPPAANGFGEPVRLPDSVNLGRNRFNATVGPDGRSLILSVVDAPDAHGLVDYCLVPRDADGTWGAALNLGPVVNDGSVGGWSAHVTPDGQDLLFMSARRTGPQRPWPATWGRLQADHRRPGGGNAVLMRMDASFLDGLAAGGDPAAPAPGPDAAGDVPAVEFPHLTGPYLGQTPPGLEPRIFAPGIVSTGLNERDLSVAPDGRRIRCGLMDQGLVTVLETRLEDGRWSEPATVPFHTDPEFFCFEPAAVPGGDAVVFLSNRAAFGQEQGRRWDNQNLHFSRPGPAGWTAPTPVPPPVTTAAAEYFATFTDAGEMVFSREDSLGHPALWWTRVLDPATLTCAAPVRLGSGVNVGRDNFNGTVAPDGSWLIFCVAGHEANMGAIDYWLSTRAPDGSWRPAVNMGEPFNGPGLRGASVSLSPDGRHLFFASNRPVGDPFAGGRVTRDGLLALHEEPGTGSLDIWWVSAQILNRYN